jgi:hypothetical protein
LVRVRLFGPPPTPTAADNAAPAAVDDTAVDRGSAPAPSPVELPLFDGGGLGRGFNHASRNCTSSRAAAAMACSCCRGEAVAKDVVLTELLDMAVMLLDLDDWSTASPLLGSCPGGHGKGKVSKQVVGV